MDPPAVFQQELTTEQGLQTDSCVTHRNLITDTHSYTKNEEIAKSRLSVQSLFDPLSIFTNYAILISCLHAAFIDWA